MEKSKLRVQKVKKQQTPNLFVGSKKKDVLLSLEQSGIELFSWQREELIENKLKTFETKSGPIGLLICNPKKESDQPGFFGSSAYGVARDEMGMWFSKLKEDQDSVLHIAANTSPETYKGVGVGCALGLYSYKGKSKPLFCNFESSAFDEGIEIGESMNSTRTLIDMPPNLLNPKSFKETIEKEFGDVKNFKVKVLGPQELKKQGYGLITGVGQAGETGPYLVHVSYRSRAAKKTVGVVGKGITFDSGGLDIKPAQYMRWMKKDMGGAGTIFGWARWAKLAKPKVNFDFIFAIAENSVSSNAFRPGDVLKAKNGVTVEIHNTDAEGRLALGSGLNYLTELKTEFDYYVDVSTLTGAIKVGLGADIGGLFSNDKKLGQVIQKASEETSDPMWLMPLPKWIRSSLSSRVADYVNCRDGFGGAISAAEFLRIFIPKGIPWFHLDLYAWTDRPKGAWTQEGATGQGLQVLASWTKELE